jgi:hypothetical protein
MSVARARNTSMVMSRLSILVSGFRAVLNTFNLVHTMSVVVSGGFGMFHGVSGPAVDDHGTAGGGTARPKEE